MQVFSAREKRLENKNYIASKLTTNYHPLDLNGVHVAQSLVFCVAAFCPVYFGHCIG
jgi:hypothetical protein